MQLPVIAIVGRPNVGKSSLMNALTRRMVSVVDPTEGVTRDRISRPMLVNDRAFELMDTGGIGVVDVQSLDSLIEKQIDAALRSAAVIIFVVDAKTGLTAPDRKIAKRLHQLARPVVLVANKTESRKDKAQVAEFSALGFGDAEPCSAKTRDHVRTVLDLAVEKLPADTPTSLEDRGLRVAIVGRRNAGKSTLVNALAGDDRVIVSEKPGTTRDAVDVTIVRPDGRSWTIIDTAGLTTHAHDGRDPIQWYSEHRAMRAVRSANVVILLVDAVKKIGALEKKLAMEIESHFKPCMLVVNKWDLVRDTTTGEFAEYYRGVLPGLKRAPIAFVSAKERTNIRRMLDLCADLHDQAGGRVATGALNRFVRVALEQQAPRIKSARVARIFYVTQTGTHPPEFRMFVNDPNLFTPEFRRYLEHRFRDTFPFQEVPVRFHYVPREREGLDKLRGGKRKSGEEE